MKNPLTPAGVEPAAFRFVVQHLSHCATAVPAEVPRGFQKLRFPDYVTMAQDGGKVVSLTPRPSLPPGNTPSTHFC